MRFLFSSLAVLVALVAYPVFVYPAIVLILSRIRPRTWRLGEPPRGVTHIITVFNEEKRIAAKLDNSMGLRAPGCHVRTVVVSDGSTDGTGEVVRRYESKGVRWLDRPRRGKEYAQLDAVHDTDDEILVFSDASTAIGSDTLEHILAPFVDPTIGAVSGTDRLESNGVGTGEDLYVGYEMALRRAESLSGSLVGLSGCFFAVRREIALQWNPTVPSDMGSALLSIASGRRAVAAEHATCVYSATGVPGAEFARKRRTALRGLRCLWVYRSAILNGDRIAAWQVLSHKWMRFAIPLWVALAVMLVSVAALVDTRRFSWILAAVLLIAAVGWIAVAVPPLRRYRLFRAAGFGAISLVAVIAACADFVAGRKEIKWSPTSRP